MNLKPLHDNVVIKGISEDEVTKAGIVLPDTADKEKPEQGEVIAIGPGKLLENGSRAPMSVAVGNKVLFKGYPHDVKVGDEEYMVVSEDDIVAIIE